MEESYSGGVAIVTLGTGTCRQTWHTGHLSVCDAQQRPGCHLARTGTR